jgi:ABC-type lipoprotein release transport system permease subunit
MAAFLEVARTGFTALRLHPLRSGVTIAALVAVLLPYLACLGLAQGLSDEAEVSVGAGADVYVTAQQFGRPVPIPLSAIDAVRRLDGVVEVVPRIVGGIVLGKTPENAVLVGLPRERLAASFDAVEGRLVEGSRLNELVVGTALARRLGLKVGSHLPPFYHSAEGERVSRVVGLFRADAGIWQANLILTSFDTAAHIFNQTGTATDLLVYTRPGYEAQVAAAVRRLQVSTALSQSLTLQAVGRADVASLFHAGLLHREGIFNLHWVLALTIGILTVLVTTGLGLSARRREIGILKATGWQTDEILLRNTVESFLLAALAISIAIVLAFGWLKGLNGYGIAGVFLTGVDLVPDFPVPFRLLPVPVLLAAVMGFVVVLSGSVYSSWRAATVAPLEAMR